MFVHILILLINLVHVVCLNMDGLYHRYSNI